MPYLEKFPEGNSEVLNGFARKHAYDNH